MSLEELDKIIAQSDPNALKSIEGVREIASEISQTIELLEVDDYLLEGKLRNVKKWKAFQDKIKLKTILFWVWLKNQIVESAKKSGVWITEKKKVTQAAHQKYRHWPTKSKLLLNGAVFLFVGALIFSYYAFIKKSLFYKQELFITSLEQISEEKWDTSKDESHETFYNSARIPKNIFKLKKIVVNIQPSASSGPNPMVALEFSFEGTSSEVLLEIKDREGEILDQVQRTIEGYSFDELNDADGKKKASDKVRNTVNRVLTLGKIRRVYLQGLILKP